MKESPALGQFGYGAAPATQAVPDQLVAEASPITTRWPVVHAVVGLATQPGMAARFARGVEPEGVHVPGVPAVAPVATVLLGPEPRTGTALPIDPVP
jgi:hypothetical protein